MMAIGVSKEHVVVAATSIVTAALTAWLTAYWSEGFRLTSHLVISPAGISNNVPAPKITLTGDEMSALDNMTSESMPDDFDTVLSGYRSGMASKILELSSDPSGETPQLTMMRAASILSQPQRFQIVLDSAKAVVESIERSPSVEYNKYRLGGYQNNESNQQKRKILAILNSSHSSAEAVQKIKQLDPALGESLAIMLRLTPLSNYETFKQFILKRDEASEEQELWEDNESTLKHVRELIKKAEIEQTGGVRLNLSVSITNMGQTPVTLSTFAMFSADDGSFQIPIEVVDGGERLIVSPSKTEQVTFVTPRRNDIKLTWQQLEAKRNDMNATARIAFFEFERARSATSEPFTISTGANIRKAMIDKVLDGRPIKSKEINEFLNNGLQSADTQ